MFDDYFCPRVVRRLQKGRDAAVLSGFLGHLHRRGHALNTIQQYVRTVESFLRWLRRRQRSLTSVDETLIRRYSCRRRPSQKPQGTIHAALRHLLRHLRSEGKVGQRAETSTPAVTRIVAEFDAHLVDNCGLAASTRLPRRRYAREFVQFVFGPGRIDWRRLRLEHVHDFVARYGTGGRVTTARVSAVSLRSFLRWLQLKGRIDGRFVAAVPSFRQWRLTSLPKVMTPEQLRAFLASFHCRDATSRRNFAMALCMTDLGLRVGEVANLRVDDVDEASGTLRLMTGKPRCDRVLPLPCRVLQAMVAYVRRDRPQTDDPGLFIRHRAPHGVAVSRELIRGVMRLAYAIVPGCETWTGTHPLRHTAANRLQRAGANLKRIADILGHRSLDTTAIYAKVDLDRLARVTLPWPGGKEVQP